MKRTVSLHQTLAGFVDHLLQWKDHPFLVGRKGYRLDTWTYREVWSSVHAFASILGEHGIGTGNRVVIALPQSPEWVVAFLAVLVQGSVVIPLDPSAPRQFIEAVCSKTSPGAFVATDALLKEGLNISATPVPLSSLKRYRSMESGPKAPEPGNRSDLAEIVFTSGTTSQPKGVKLSHGNILFNIDPIQRGIGEHRVLVGLFPRIRMLCTVPYTHMFGQVTGIFLPILLGSTVYFTDDTAPAVLIRIIKRNRILTLITVPRIMKLLADHARYEMKARGVYDRFLKRWDKRQHLPWPIRVPFFLDLHRIMGMRFWSFIVGGASLDPETHEFWRRTVFSVFQGYGLTETAPIVTMFNPFRHPRDSVGIVMPGQELRLAPDGEILVRGGNIMQGYYDDPGSTREVLEDGWLHTGDIGEIDENGRVFIRGRKKEMILTSDGHNVYPTDVEHVLNEQPGVRESVVFGRPGPSGEAVHAVLLLEPGADPERIVQTANTLLGAHQRVRSFEPWDEADFPRTSTLKVKKAEVIRRVTTREKPPAASDDIFLGLVAGSARQDAKLSDDLGLDSLDMVELVSRLEKRYGISLDETIIGPETTVGEIESLAASASHWDAPAASVSLPMPRWARRFPARFLRLMLTDGIILPIFRIFCRIQVEGLDNLRVHEGPRILCANHQSDIDPLVILLALPLGYRQLITPAMGLNRFHAYFTRLGNEPDHRELRRRSKREGLAREGGKREKVRSHGMKRFAHHLEFGIVTLLFQTFPFPQGTAYRPSMEYTGELLDRGSWILIFPEGRVSNDGKVGAFKGGISLIAEKTGVPVYPVRIEGMQRVLPPGHWWPRRGTVRIAFGKSLRYAGEGHEQFARSLEQAVRLLQ